MNETVNRINLFAENCTDDDVLANVILQAYINEKISLEEANEISAKFGIMGPLGYFFYPGSYLLTF